MAMQIPSIYIPKATTTISGARIAEAINAFCDEPNGQPEDHYVYSLDDTGFWAYNKAINGSTGFNWYCNGKF